jgi:hypothetical protein
MHTIIVVDQDSQPLRVACGYCGSEHNYRGGPRIDPSGGPVSPTPPPDRPRDEGTAAPRRATSEALPLVTERERTGPPIMLPDTTSDLELLLRRIIREEAGVSAVTPAEKWRGGTLVIKPGNPALQEKSWPIETFFHKVVMIRNRLRTLEQQVNASDLPDDAKVKLQVYISGCYGSLTSFNILFANDEDQVRGSER